MSGVPYTFGNATTTIALSNLDTNFATPVTIGNTTVGLGNTITTIGNLTLTNVNIASGTSNVSSSIISNGTSNVSVTSLNGNIVASTNGTTAVTIDTNQNVGIGVTPSATTIYTHLSVANQGSGILSYSGNNDIKIASGVYYNSGYKYGVTGYAISMFEQANGVYRWQVAPSGTAGNAVSFTQAMTLQLATFVSGSFQNVLFIKDSANTVSTFNAVNSTSWNSSVNSAMVLGSANGRSISAAGTLNASGADYAEYMTKSGDFTINKGDICGIDVNGKLTNVFANAISFVVKSTNPSYVGGDNWGNEEVLGVKPVKPTQAEGESDADYQTALTAYETALTAWNAKAAEAQKMVDRIAFSGQVPVNVIGATAGQYIVPIANQDGFIGGQAISESAMTLQQYMQSVGKVISVVGNVTTIIVKVA